jgi:hypothetical protein
MRRQLTLPNGFVPRDYQRDAMRYFDKGGTRGVFVWPRRGGKDTFSIHQTIKAAVERTGQYFHCLPTHKQARKVIWDSIDKQGRRLIDVAIPKEIRKAVDQTEMKITLFNGSIWQLVGADYIDSLVGANPVGLVMSEAAITNPLAWSFFRPVLAENGGWAMFISTPRGKNWFYRLLATAKADPRWYWSHLNAYQTGHIDQSVLESERSEMPDELYRQEYLCDFSAANVGSIYGKYLEAAEREGRIAKALEPDPMGQVIVSSDIGFRDKAAFWWWRPMLGGFEVFDYDEGSGLDAEEWIDRLREKPRANILYLPHDAKAKTFQSRHSVIEQFLRGNVADEVRVNPVRKKQDSINAVRTVLPRCRFDGTTCEVGIEALMQYHWKYDEEQRTFSREPEHDWSSHGADAFAEGASVLLERMPAPKPKEIIVPPADESFSLEMLWDTAPRQSRRIG